MRFALYLDLYTISINSFYTKVALVESFLSKGQTLDIYYPLDLINKERPDEKSDDNFFKTLKDFESFNVTVIPKLPQPKNYDVLLITDTYIKEWLVIDNVTIKDTRYLCALKFIEENKHVICIRDTAMIEYRFINSPSIKHGICASPLYGTLPITTKTFTMPLLSNLSFPKKDLMSESDFFDKYNLDKNLKIISIFPGKISKWRKDAPNNKNVTQVMRNLEFFNKNIEQISNICNEYGYQLVGKLHIRDNNSKWLTKEKHDSLFHYKYIKYINPEDTNELLQYSDRCITYATTMVYQMYLYDLPSFDIGTGIYYLNWSSPNETSINSILKNYNNGIDLIYGTVANTFFHNGIEQLINFLKFDFKIKRFKYLYNNPIYGNSYKTTIDDVRNSILGALLH